MGINFSQFETSDSEIVYDCNLNGYDYVVKGTCFIRLVICGQCHSGKSLLFKSFQRRSSAVEKKAGDISFTTKITWLNSVTKEIADISITDFNFEKSFTSTDTSSSQPNSIQNEYINLLQSSDCVIFVADPRQSDLFETFRRVVSFISMNTTLIVINNFKDKSDDWLYTSEDISRQCQTILAESGKYVDFWNIDACIGARYGLKELYILMIQPFYKSKMRVLQAMVRNTAHNMEICRDSVERYLQKSSYEKFCENMRRHQEQQRVETSDEPHSRDFVTQHSFYLHEHSNRKETIISSKRTRPVNYSTLTTERVEDWRALESGSDCDDLSPIDIIRQKNQAVVLDPAVLTESLADFFEDVGDEEVLAEKVSKSVEAIPVYVGEAKEVKPAEKKGELRTEAYPAPKEYVPREMDDVSYSQDVPAVREPASFEESMGFSK